jgi:hypothetical protein
MMAREKYLNWPGEEPENGVDQNYRSAQTALQKKCPDCSTNYQNAETSQALRPRWSIGQLANADSGLRGKKPAGMHKKTSRHAYQPVDSGRTRSSYIH